MVGRESLRLLFIEHVHGAFDASAGERAFLADWRAPRSPARQQALEGAYRKLVPRERIAHEISNSVPGIRLWPSDPPVADYIAVGEVRLRAGFKNFRLGGIFL